MNADCMHHAREVSVLCFTTQRWRDRGQSTLYNQQDGITGLVNVIVKMVMVLHEWTILYLIRGNEDNRHVHFLHWSKSTVHYRLILLIVERLKNFSWLHKR